MLVNNKTLKKLILVLVAVSMIIGLTHFASLIARAENDDHLETEIVNTDESQDVDYSYLYEDGKIKIYNLKQLQAIGSHQPVKLTDNNEESFSKGDVLLVENTVITYSLDAQYLLMNDIVLDNENIWSLPDNFTGSFTSLETQNNKTLYDQQIDTIYIYNNYQLKILLSDNASKEPVMTQDYHASEFGMGQMIYPQDSQDYLTYNHSHHYVLSQFFTSDMPELISQQMKATQAETKETSDGRQFAGQVIWTDPTNQKEYILIGNKEQLAAIGSNQIVRTAIYSLVGKMQYGGDADLLKSQNGSDDYNFPSSSAVFIGNGVDQQTGEKSTKIVGGNSGHKYSRSENYIIFRDIDLNNETWTPLMFSGTMEGRLNMVSDANVTISHINVKQSEDLDMKKNLGIGFFGTISSERDDSYVKSKGQVSVSHLTLENVSVDNQSDKVQDSTSLVERIIKGLSLAVTTLLETLLKILQLDSLTELLTGLANLGADDITNFATGGFVGRIYGDVLIKECLVEDLSISNVKDITGGFVGSIEGMTEYELVSRLGEAIVKLLETLLDAIPFLGLGDLVRILVDGGLLDIKQLIPISYRNPVIDNCSVSLNTRINSTKKYVGGFVGRQVGSFITNSTITGNSTTISGEKFVGGFSGLTVNAEIEGALNDLGINLIDAITNQSIIAGCSVEGVTSITASSTYAGGFTGVLADSYAIDCSVNGMNSVSSTEDYSGGFSGRATLGWAVSLGEDYGEKKYTLLSVIKESLGKLLSGDANKETVLLSLVGISPSVVAGCSVNGNSLEVSGKNYVGGLIGQGDGVQIYTSAQEQINSLRPINKKKVNYNGKNQPTVIQNLKSVKATEKYAGGIAGYVATASAGGILDTTLGIGNYLPFKIDNVNISGVSAGYTIEASHEYAGGAIGMAIGGKMNNVTLTNIQYVNALNHVGGFIGSGGTGSLVSAGGLNLLGLDLVKVDNLLNLAQAVVLDIDSAQVIGISSGMSIKATGSNQNGEVTLYDAAGFIGESTSANINGASVENVKEIKADINNGIAGGFVGSSNTGGLASISEDKTSVPGIVDISNLISAAG